MNSFLLGDIKVDVARCQLIKNDETCTIEPKVMDVLHYFAKHQGEVISQEALFNDLWPNGIYNPGSVQRCITILRKSLGDNVKNPSFIVTHPKRGYSLIAKVSKLNPAQKIRKKQTPFTKIKYLLILLTFSAFFILIWSVTTPETINFKGKLTPLTSSHHYDFMPGYSPDGSWLAFISQQDGDSHLWLKNLKTGVLTQLTQISDNYRQLSWHQNSKQLAFVTQNEQANTVSWLTLDSPDNIQVLFTTPATAEIWKIHWHQDEVYYLTAQIKLNTAPVTQLKVFNLSNNKHTLILKNNAEFTPYRMAFSPDNWQIALAGEDSQNGVEIRLFDIHKETLSKPIKHLALGFTDIAWHPIKNQILVLHQNQLLLLSLTGETTTLPYYHYQKIYNPVFNHDGTHIALSLTENDIDIYQNQGNIYKKIINSTGEDGLASISPDNQKIAYISTKSGYQQVFIYHNNSSELIYDNHSEHPIYRAPVWSPDGNTLSFMHHKKLHFYDIISKKHNTHSINGAANSILDWYHNEPSLLLHQKSDNISRFAKYNVATQEIAELSDSGIHYAAKLNTHDQLIFTKNNKIISTGEQADRSLRLITENDINSPIFPTTQGYIYQNNHEIITIKANTKSATQLPEYIAELIDVSPDGKTMLFNSYNVSGANIVSFQ